MSSTIAPRPRIASNSASEIVAIRRIRPTDASEISAFFGRLSAETRLRRFLGYCSLGPTLARAMCGPDHVHAEGFIAVVKGGQHPGRIVGHVCLEPAREGEEEIAVVVADEYQRRAIGRRLLEAAAEWATTRGIRHLCATAYSTNTAVLRLFASAGDVRVLRVAAGTADLRIQLRAPARAA